MSETLIPNIELFIANIDPFSRLSNELLTRVIGSIKIIYLVQGEQIPFPKKEKDKYLFIVRTGSVEQISADGTLRGRLGEEDVFGFSLFSKKEIRYQIKAMENTLLYLIPAKIIYDIQSNYPEYAPHFTERPDERIHSAVQSTWSDINSSSFFNTVEKVSNDSFVLVDAQDSIQRVATLMRAKDISCAMILENNTLQGIVTNTDMVERVIVQGMSTSMPVSAIMSVSPITIKAHQTVFDGAISMMEKNVKNLPIIENGYPIGLLSLHQLFPNQRMQAVYLIDKIKKSRSEMELVKHMFERDQIFLALGKDKVPADLISTILCTIMDVVNQRLIDIAIDRLGSVPCDFAWLVSGSHARKEVHILSDQDSAIIISDDATAKDKLYFQHLAMIVCKGMDSCGYELCSGKFMAATLKWCQPISIWREYYKKWIKNPEYEYLLHLSVFLDTRVIYGNKQYRYILVNEFKEMISHRSFLAKLIRDAVENRTPLGIFHSLILTKNGKNEKTLNIKRYGINIIVDLARIYALFAKSDACNTKDRLIAINQAGLLNDATLKNIISAYDFLRSFRFSYQVDLMNKGEIPDNQINPNYFGGFERKHIKDAFRLIDNWQQYAKMKLS